MTPIERAKADLEKLENEIARIHERILKLRNYIEMAPLYDCDAPSGDTGRSHRPGSSGAAVQASMDLILEKGQRIHTRALLDALLAKGIQIGGANPAQNLSGLLSRANELNNNRALGWGLAKWGDAAQGPVPEPGANRDEAHNPPSEN